MWLKQLHGTRSDFIVYEFYDPKHQMVSLSLLDMYTRRFMDVDASSLKSPIGIVGLPWISNVGKISIQTLTSILDAKHV